MGTLLRTAWISAILAPPALAGDFATLEPIGFSADGSVFAFEQYGIQDGSGFPYSEIFFIDLEADRFLSPSPVRTRLEDEGATLPQAREAARRDAGALFDTHRPNDHPGRAVASNPPTELSADPHRIAFLPRAIEPSIDEPVELRLELIPFGDAPEHCSGFGHTISGFRLLRIAEPEGESARVLHEDQSLPASRNCPYDYRLAEIRLHDWENGAAKGVVIVGVKQIGFEGPDMRYIAVPLSLPSVARR